MDFSQIEIFKYFFSEAGTKEIQNEIRRFKEEYGETWLSEFKADFPDLTDIIDLVANYSEADAFLKLKEFVSEEIEYKNLSFFAKAAARGAIFGFLETHKQNVFNLHRVLKQKSINRDFNFRGEFLYMTPEQIGELLGQQNTLFEQSLKMKNVVLILSKGKTIALSSISTVEDVAVLDETDTETGESVPVIYIQNGHSVELTPGEYEIFKPYWNRILYVDNLLAKVNLTLTSALFPQPTPAQLAAQTSPQQ